MQSSERRLIVLCANLQEAIDPADLAVNADLRNFALRVPTVLPAAPDAVLLQDVVGPSAQAAARLLSEAIGQPYTAAVAGGERAIQRARGKPVVTNTAILINSATLQTVSSGGFQGVSYRRRDARPGRRPRWFRQAHTAARDVRSGEVIALASIHFPRSDRFASLATSFVYKGRWAASMVELLASAYPSAGVRVIGGDFNNRRCADTDETVDCEVTPFWAELTAAGYRDAVFTTHGGDDASLREQYRKGDRTARTRIDYIFVKGAAVTEASHDVGYGAKSGDPDFYSDHRFLWAGLQLQVGAPDSGTEPVPEPEEIPARREGDGLLDRLLRLLRRLFRGRRGVGK